MNSWWCAQVDVDIGDDKWQRWRQFAGGFGQLCYISRAKKIEGLALQTFGPLESDPKKTAGCSLFERRGIWRSSNSSQSFQRYSMIISLSWVILILCSMLRLVVPFLKLLLYVLLASVGTILSITSSMPSCTACKSCSRGSKSAKGKFRFWLWAKWAMTDSKHPFCRHVDFLEQKTKTWSELLLGCVQAVLGTLVATAQQLCCMRMQQNGKSMHSSTSWKACRPSRWLLIQPFF